MGLDAVVNCRCWEDGLCYPPPAKLLPGIRLNADNCQVSYEPPDGLTDDARWSLKYDFLDWQFNRACSHTQMVYAQERISNISGIGQLRGALRGIGSHFYEKLFEQVLERTDDVTWPEAARQCLAELDHFAAQGPFGMVAELVDSQTGNILDSDTAYGGWLGGHGQGPVFRLLLDGRLQIAQANDEGLFEVAGNAKMLPSAGIKQKPVGDGRWRFTDLLTGEHFFGSQGVKDWAFEECPPLLELRQFPDTPARYDYCIAPLRRVLQAALETRYPVLWC